VSHSVRNKPAALNFFVFHRDRGLRVEFRTRNGWLVRRGLLHRILSQSASLTTKTTLPAIALATASKSRVLQERRIRPPYGQHLPEAVSGARSACALVQAIRQPVPAAPPVRHETEASRFRTFRCYRPKDKEKNLIFLARSEAVVPLTPGWFAAIANGWLWLHESGTYV
jgi:hypothetical protein